MNLKFWEKDPELIELKADVELIKKDIEYMGEILKATVDSYKENIQSQAEKNIKFIGEDDSLRSLIRELQDKNEANVRAISQLESAFKERIAFKPPYVNTPGEPANAKLFEIMSKAVQIQCDKCKTYYTSNKTRCPKCGQKTVLNLVEIIDG